MRRETARTMKEFDLYIRKDVVTLMFVEQVFLNKLV